MEIELSDEERRRLLVEALDMYRDVLWDMGADEELELVEELMDRIEK